MGYYLVIGIVVVVASTNEAVVGRLRAIGNKPVLTNKSLVKESIPITLSPFEIIRVSGQNTICQVSNSADEEAGGDGSSFLERIHVSPDTAALARLRLFDQLLEDRFCRIEKFLVSRDIVHSAPCKRSSAVVIIVAVDEASPPLLHAGKSLMPDFFGELALWKVFLHVGQSDQDVCLVPPSSLAQVTDGIAFPKDITHNIYGLFCTVEAA